ncbi:MAG: hypothetical protein AYL33_004770, partial [Candidatus Bathyarchaeota archaeon B63]
MKMGKSRFSSPKRRDDEAKSWTFGDSILSEISERARLPEGKEAVRRILREVYRHGRIGTKELAFATRLPIPVVAAVRRELEKRGLLARQGGAVLTGKGEDYVENVLGLSIKESLICESCSGKTIRIGDRFQAIVEKLRMYAEMRPAPYTWLDQAFGTPETAVLRALFMLEEGDVEGRRIIFLGDDDLTSIAVGLLRASRGITVIDVDDRLVSLIDEISEKEGLNIESVHHDLRNPLPSDLRGMYDVVFTDPPYTIGGLKLFLSRGIDALRGEKCSSIYLAFAHKPPEEMLSI